MDRVTRYNVGWSAADDRGFVEIEVQTGLHDRIEVRSHEQFLILLEILRHGHQVHYDHEQKLLCSSPLVPGLC